MACRRRRFCPSVDPLFDGVREKLRANTSPPTTSPAISRAEWADALGLRAGIPIPVGAFDAHWDAIGAGCREGDVVNVVGTSTCIIAMAKRTALVPGVCGVVPGSVHPRYTGIEAGLSATGDIFDAIARRAGTKVAELSQGLEQYRAGQTGLLRLSWDNGDRTVLVNAELGGVTLGWNLMHTAQDELFAAIEGTAFHTRIILERMAEHGVPVRARDQRRRHSAAECGAESGLCQRAGQAGSGAGRRCPPAWAPASSRCLPPARSLLSSRASQCSACRTAHFCRSRKRQRSTNASSRIYRAVYFALGTPDAPPAALGAVLPELKRIAAEIAAAS